MGPWFGVIAGGTGTATKKDIKKVFELQQVLLICIINSLHPYFVFNYCLLPFTTVYYYFVFNYCLQIDIFLHSFQTFHCCTFTQLADKKIMNNFRPPLLITNMISKLLENYTKHKLTQQIKIINSFQCGFQKINQEWVPFMKPHNFNLIIYKMAKMQLLTSIP